MHESDEWTVINLTLESLCSLEPPGSNYGQKGPSVRCSIERIHALCFVLKSGLYFVAEILTRWGKVCNYEQMHESDEWTVINLSLVCKFCIMHCRVNLA